MEIAKCAEPMILVPIPLLYPGQILSREAVHQNPNNLKLTFGTHQKLTNVQIIVKHTLTTKVR